MGDVGEDESKGRTVETAYDVAEHHRGCLAGADGGRDP
jgi:hypothetical protein